VPVLESLLSALETSSRRFAHVFKHLAKLEPAGSVDGNRGLEAGNVGLADEIPPEWGCGLAPEPSAESLVASVAKTRKLRKICSYC